MRIIGAAPAIAAALFLNKTLAEDWDLEIRSAEAHADQLWTEARRLGLVSVGTALNELGIPEHECEITGKLLGLHEIVGHLNGSEKVSIHRDWSQPQIDDLTAASNLGASAVYLSNWVTTARRLVGRSNAFLIMVWNLNCVGSHEISEALYIPRPPGVEF